MLKRIGLFLITNIAIMAMISLLLYLFNVQPYLTRQGLDYQSLMIMALIVGFSGAFISLMLSKWMAKHAYSIQLINRPSNSAETWLVARVQELAQQLSIGMPEVGIYDSMEPNAFATGWNRNNTLVAVSTGLLNNMNQDEIEGVIGHEMSHVANGDMVTLTLIQGVINTFVFFFARVAAYAVMQFFRRDSEDNPIGGFAYYIVVFLFELLFGILATLVVMAFARYREYRADNGSARLLGRTKMIRALQRLQQLTELPVDNRAPAFAAFKISTGQSILGLFSSHPPLAKRIEALEQLPS